MKKYGKYALKEIKNIFYEKNTEEVSENGLKERDGWTYFLLTQKSR